MFPDSAGSSMIESLDPIGRQNWACQSIGFICASSPSRQKLWDEGLPGTPLITNFDLFSVGASTSSMASHSHPTRVVWVLQPQSPNYAGWRTHIARAGRSGEMFGGEVDKVSAPCHVGLEPFGAEPVRLKLQTNREGKLMKKVKPSPYCWHKEIGSFRASNSVADYQVARLSEKIEAHSDALAQAEICGQIR